MTSPGKSSLDQIERGLDGVTPGPERIWLQSYEDSTAVGEDRLWCEDKVWPNDPEDHEPTEYVRADLFRDLEDRLAKAAEALEQAETDRAEQWRLRRDAEGSRDAACAAADSLRIERDMLRTVISYILEGWDFWQVNPHDREPPRDAIRRARTALSQIRSEK